MPATPVSALRVGDERSKRRREFAFGGRHDVQHQDLIESYAEDRTRIAVPRRLRGHVQSIGPKVGRASSP
jgi:hypothetical protein